MVPRHCHVGGLKTYFRGVGSVRLVWDSWMLSCSNDYVVSWKQSQFPVFCDTINCVLSDKPGLDIKVLEIPLLNLEMTQFQGFHIVLYSFCHFLPLVPDGTGHIPAIDIGLLDRVSSNTVWPISLLGMQSILTLVPPTLHLVPFLSQVKPLDHLPITNRSKLCCSPCILTLKWK